MLSNITIKNFDEDWNKAKFKVGTVEPSGYTRIGAVLRHSGAMLDKRDTKNKWVILISDGKPMIMISMKVNWHERCKTSTS